MSSWQNLLTEVRQCTLCEPELPMGARPVVQLHPNAKILVAGQAPAGVSMPQVSRLTTPVATGCASGWALIKPLFMTLKSWPLFLWGCAIRVPASPATYHQGQNVLRHGGRNYCSSYLI